MPIQPNNPEVNADLVRTNDDALLAALVGAITAEPEQGFHFPIETAEDLSQDLQRLNDLISEEYDPCLSRELVNYWPGRTVDQILPITNARDFSHKILFKVRGAWLLDEFWWRPDDPGLDDPGLVDWRNRRRR